MAGILGADVLGKGLDSLAAAGSKLLDQQIQMKNAGMTHLQIVQETAEAYRSMAAVRGPDVAERLAGIRELRGVVGAGASGNDYREINATLPDYLRLKSMIGDRGANDLFRAIEMQGAARYQADGSFDLGRFHRYEDSALRTLQAGGGNIRPEDLRNVMQTSAVTARGYDPEAFWNLMMTPILEMHGDRAGTALTAMSRAFYGGVMPERNARELERLGVFSGGSVKSLPHMSRHQMADLKRQGYTFGVGEGGAIIGRGATLGADELNNPNQGFFPWIKDVFGPLLQKDYQNRIASHPGNTESFDAYVRDEMYKALPAETARRFGAMIVTQLTSVQRDQTLRELSPGFDAYNNNQYNYRTELDNLKNSWASLMQTLGLPAARDGAHLLHELGMGIDYFTRAAAAHPNAARDLIRLAGGLAAVTALSGTMAIAGVALGPLASGLRLMTGVLAGGEVASAASTAAMLGGGAAVGGSLLGVAAGITALGVAVVALPPIMQWLATRFGVENAHPGVNARGMAFDHAAAQAPHPASANLEWWDTIRNSWNTPHASHGNARGYQAHPVQHPAHGNLEPDAVRHVGTAQIVVMMPNGRELASAVQEVQFQQAQQQMRASGTSPDVIQHPQLPGRAIGR
ncbi:hypothetical protein IFJ82_09565 [Novacetimonas hansenii]|uniref:hypothetical protein n=1 Tax=Novacetimonas hansenii TaxID=436 RepID=UPI001784E981|nr:hypothetical protein [Novacetimonas hansenii]QOF94199.1 hypothetical protein IFJ82_09565 [Novacetimonas hansenii]